MPDTYTTRGGDIWDDIAYRMLGSCKYVSALMDANRAYIHTTIFSPGVVLKLPKITKKTSISSLPPWRR